MRAVVAVACNLLFILADIMVTTLLYIRGTRISLFMEDLGNFDLFCSTVDLWVTLLVRVTLLLGAAIGVSRNVTEGPRRVADSQNLAVILCLVVMVYAVTKLLLFSEHEASLTHSPWFLSLFSWTCASSLGTVLLWKLLARVRPPRPSLKINAGSEDSGDRAPVLGPEDCSGDECEEEGEKCSDKRKGESRSTATVSQLLAYCRKDAGLLGVAFLFLLISALCEAFIPYYTGQAIDGIVIHKSMADFTKPIIYLTVFALVSSIAMGVRGGVFSLTFARLNVRLRNLLFRSLVHQEIGFFDENHTGDITSRLTSDTTQVSDLISENVNLFLRSLVKGVGYCIFMFGMSWKLSLVTLMGFPFIAIVSKFYGEYYKKLAKEVQNSLAQANKVAEETISSMKTVRSFANEDAEADNYFAKLQEMFQLNKRQAVAYACYMWCSCISELAMQVSILYYGGHLVVSGQMTGGTLISFVIYELELGECLEDIASVYTGLMQGVGAAEKVFEFIDRKPKLSHNGQLAPDTCKGLVEFKNVTFSYPTRPDTPILKDVSFTLRPGEVTALVGPSGSGKSSCVSLLENFYRPQQGEVFLDGHPVQEYQHSYLHARVSLVGQEPVLFARSVQNNITYGLTDCSTDAVVQAAIKANAHEFVTQLPNGYNTGVGEKGAQLSGGQKQRVAIARALIRNPHVLILDEATSALDAESEYIVQQALNTIMHRHTVLVIAHRLSTVEKAGNIIVIDKGWVVEQGSHKELMAMGGLYSKLVQRQVLGIETGADVLNPPKNSMWHLGKSKLRKEESSDSEEDFRL
ncbi:ABC-type oligopeptide transporter ABCB9 isoform X1 [Lepisosteus oculatus]|uniref:ABC-type oligopeptide transporter ABCB9 isoform X1 n=1 Tax=Lepisosteus oculatus TaxID=7918 RepID=UPI0035F51AA9